MHKLTAHADQERERVFAVLLQRQHNCRQSQPSLASQLKWLKVQVLFFTVHRKGLKLLLRQTNQIYTEDQTTVFTYYLKPSYCLHTCTGNLCGKSRLPFMGIITSCLENRFLQKSFGAGLDYGFLVSATLLIPHEQWLNQLRIKGQMEKTGHAPACECL